MGNAKSREHTIEEKFPDSIILFIFLGVQSIGNIDDPVPLAICEKKEKTPAYLVLTGNNHGSDNMGCIRKQLSDNNTAIGEVFDGLRLHEFKKAYIENNTWYGSTIVTGDVVVLLLQMFNHVANKRSPVLSMSVGRWNLSLPKSGLRFGDAKIPLTLYVSPGRVPRTEDEVRLLTTDPLKLNHEQFTILLGWKRKYTETMADKKSKIIQGGTLLYAKTSASMKSLPTKALSLVSKDIGVLVKYFSEFEKLRAELVLQQKKRDIVAIKKSIRIFLELIKPLRTKVMEIYK
jgi:hypothetical protein